MERVSSVNHRLRPPSLGALQVPKNLAIWVFPVIIARRKKTSLIAQVYKINARESEKSIT
jgi:hypothetical protein